MRAFARWFIVAAAIGLAAACGPKEAGGVAATGDQAAPEMVLGSPDAKVTVTEYASVTCPHCARFNEQVFPAFKAKYVDTGQVRYVFREFLTAPEPVAAAGFLVARCAGKDKYFSVLDTLFQNQQQLYNDPRGLLFRVGQGAGMTEAQVTACIQDEAALAALNKRQDKATGPDGITGTPSFLVNGKKIEGQVLAGTTYQGGEITLAQLDAALAPLLKR
jgi:protein-disulfide isomerase